MNASDFVRDRRVRMAVPRTQAVYAVVTGTLDDEIFYRFEGQTFPRCCYLFQARQSMIPLCFNCNKPKEDHADNLKCLYGPENWE